MLSLIASIYERATNIDVKVYLEQIESASTLSSHQVHQYSTGRSDQLTKLNNAEKDSLTKLKMDPLAESMTINNINTNKHVNLVQVKKIKMANSATISLDIIAGNCDYAKCNRDSRKSTKGVIRKILLAFSWRQNYRQLYNTCHRYGKEVPAVSGLRVLCFMWIILVHTCTFLFYIADNKNYRINSKNLIIDGIFSYGSLSIDTYFFLW